MKRHRVLGLVAGTLLVSGAVVNAGQEPALESTLVRRAAVLSGSADALVNVVTAKFFLSLPIVSRTNQR